MTEFHIAECAIRQLHARYADAAWRQDVEAFGDCFAEDCEWRVAGQIMRGPEQAMAFMRGSFPMFRRLLLRFGTPILEVGDGEASGRTYVVEQSQFMDGRPFGPIGIYYERFVDEGDRWRFKWRLFETAYVGPPGLSEQYLDVMDYGPPPAMPPLDAPTFDPSGVGKKSAADGGL